MSETGEVGFRNYEHESGAAFSSNSIRLTLSEWIVAAVILTALAYCMPLLWLRVESFIPQANYRLPYRLSSDYWLYSRYCNWACSRDKVLVVGDSVVWGHYVPCDSTLSGSLNKITGRDEFANLGVDGIHPVALAGLLRHYGRDISGNKIVLHLNPLWMSSRKHDLQIEKEFHFNHPQLVPQFIPRIPCYKDSFSTRLGIVVRRLSAFLGWASHLRIAYFQGMDLPRWTIEYPYKSPLKAIAAGPDLDESQYERRDTAPAGNGVVEPNIEWVELETSLQWRFFRRAVMLLSARGNRVFVLVGPFNEHILKGKSAQIYNKMKSDIEFWLKQNRIPYCIAAVLPSTLYYDVSHPTDQGYMMLAEQLFADELFTAFLGQEIP